MSTESIEIRLSVCIRKIAFADGVGGMEKAAADHIRGMAAAGIKVVLYTPMRFLEGDAPSGVAVKNVSWPRWNSGTGRPTFGLAYWVWSKRLSLALSKGAKETDVIHFHGGSVGALPLRSPENTPTVMNPHGMEEFAPTNLPRMINRYFLRKLARRGRMASCVVATDRQLIQPVVKNIGATPDHVQLIPNSVDVHTLTNLASLAMPHAQYTVVTIGRLVRNKGYDLLLQALRLAQRDMSIPLGYKWIHFGNGPELDRLRADSISDPVINLEIKTQRTDNEVQQALSVADIFVQPSRYEGSSLTTLEAMSHGRKVVGTPVGGIPDKIREGETGFLASAATSQDLADAIKRAVNASSEVGERARELVDQVFSKTATDAAYVELYKRLAERKTAGYQNPLQN